MFGWLRSRQRRKEPPAYTEQAADARAESAIVAATASGANPPTATPPVDASPRPPTAAETEAAQKHFRRAEAARAAGDVPAAIEAFQVTIRLLPDHGEAHNNVGGLLRESGRADDALSAFREAVRSRPKLAPAWFNLGTSLRDRGELDEAVTALKRSLELDPKQADAWYWLGNAWMGLGDAARATEAYRSALRLDTRLLVARWGLTMAQVVPVPESVAAAAQSREAFGRELDKLAAWCRTQRPADGFRSVGATQPYYLAYQQQNNVELLRRYGRLCVDLMRPWEAKVGLPAAAPPRGARCRVGIVSAHFVNHSVWNAIVRGWLEHLDLSKIELHLFHLGSQQDKQTAFARERATRFHGGPRDWSLWAKEIAESRLDVLVYPEVGMDAVTAKLAAARLAPVQVASWGHPETTGLPSIDHFVSAHDMEPADAGDHYTEQLARLPGLGCCPLRFDTAPAAFDVQRHGIPKGARILLCPGTAFKYTPEHDGLWVEVARRASPCRLVFFRSRPAALADALEARLRRAFAAADLDFDGHVVFIPWQNQAAFFGLMKVADVMLDSPGFSGFNTAMQAVECGLPIVACEGSFLRGRFASAIVRQMELPDCVATTAEAYVDAVVRLSGDDGLRQQLRRQVETRGRALFKNDGGARAMGRFLLDAAGR